MCVHTCARMRICTFGNTPPPQSMEDSRAEFAPPPRHIEKFPTPMALSTNDHNNKTMCYIRELR